MIPFEQPFNSQLHTDTNSLAAAFQTKPEQISPIVTNLAGRKSDALTLSFLSEGLANTKSISQDEYEYSVFTEPDDTRQLAADVSETDPGLGNTTFELEFPDSWFPMDYTLFSESGIQVRIMEGPYPKGSNVGYLVQMMDPNRDSVMPAEDVVAGAKFTKGYALAEQDYSRGNASNWAAPYKVRHKLGVVRKSYNFSGNAANTVVVFPMQDANGNRFDTWLRWEAYKHFMDFKQECESFYLYGVQNYDANGKVPMKGKNGYPIVSPPGVLDQIIHRDTYSKLTHNKLKTIIGQLYYQMYDADQMNVILMTGTGGIEEFDDAMKEYIGANAFTHYSSGSFINGDGSNLQLDGYFRRYQHVHGHSITVMYNKLFDHGPRARARRKHPVTGYSLESYRMVFLDQSRYDGQSNLMMVNKKGREMKQWTVAGSTLPPEFENAGGSRASDVDGASVHWLKHSGIALMRFDTSLDLDCVATHGNV